MARNLYLKGLKTAKRQSALEFFRDHPNEIGEGAASSQVLAQLRGLGLLVQHEGDRANGKSLMQSAWSLSPDEELAASLWAQGA